MEGMNWNLPVLALRGLTVFPHMSMSLDVEREVSLRALEKAMEGDQRIFLVTQREIGTEAPEERDLYEVGTVCAIRQILKMSGSTVQAVKEGMHNLTTGSLSYYFSNCVVSAGAKTGTAETGIANTNNGVFVCFAPYDDPQIAVAVVIEKGGSGAALASTAVDIVNSYFSQEEIGAVVIGENTLLK